MPKLELKQQQYGLTHPGIPVRILVKVEKIACPVLRDGKNPVRIEVILTKILFCPFHFGEKISPSAAE